MENITYADMRLGLEVKNTQTDELGEIVNMWIHNGIRYFDVQLTSGSDKDETISMSLAELTTFWRKV